MQQITIEKLRNIPLEKIMTIQPIFVNKNDCLDRVEVLFREMNIRHLPVVDDQANLVGIISKTDFNRLQHGLTLFNMPNKEDYDRKLFRMTRVVEVMTKELTQLNSKNTLQEAYQLFKKNVFHAIPIVDNKHLVGIVTPIDLLNYLLEEND